MNASRGFNLLRRSLNGDCGYGLALMLALAAVLLPLAGGAALRDAWRFERSAIADGEWWRLAGAHLVHLDARHALANTAGIALLWGLFARSYRPGSWLAALAVITAGVNAGLWWLTPSLQWYVGASGVLHGVFACGCVALLAARERVGYIAALVFLGKLLWEQWQGALPLAGNVPVVTEAHLFGAAGGLLAGLALHTWRYTVRPSSQGRME